MLDNFQVSTLLGASTANQSAISPLFTQNSETTLATITQEVVGGAFGIEQVSDTVSLSDELVSYINENLESDQAEPLLADISAIEQLADLGNNDGVSSINSQLLGTGTGNILDLLA